MQALPGLFIKRLAILAMVLGLLAATAWADDEAHPSWVTYEDDKPAPQAANPNLNNPPGPLPNQPAQEPKLDSARTKSPAANTNPPQKTRANKQPEVIASPWPAKPVTLYGRIEEIASHPGAKLPALKAQVPILDTSQQQLLSGTTAVKLGSSVTTLDSRVTTNVYPPDFAGQYGGLLSIASVQLDPLRWQIDPDEASQERELLKPGSSGQVSFNFSQFRKVVYLKPAQVVFSVPMTQSRLAAALGQSGQMGGLAQLAAQSGLLNRLPYIFALQLGDLDRGVGVTGNTLASQVMKNTVKQLATNIIEQDVVTYDTNKSRTTGQTRHSYTESVLRFTRQNANQLYVQAATVSYTEDGSFTEKILLHGLVTRGQEMPLTRLVNSMSAGGLSSLTTLLQGIMPSSGSADTGQALQQLLQGGGLNQLMPGSGSADTGQALQQLLQGGGLNQLMPGSGSADTGQALQQLLQGGGLNQLMPGSGSTDTGQALQQLLQGGGLNQLMPGSGSADTGQALQQLLQGGGLNQLMPGGGNTGVQNY